MSLGINCKGNFLNLINTISQLLYSIISCCLVFQGSIMADDQQFCLRWNNFQTNFTSQFKALRLEEDFVDVTLACEGKRIKAHKLVLSACSPYFKELFKVS